MTVEWLRRHDSTYSTAHLRTYLFTTDPITEIEKEPRPEQTRPPPLRPTAASTSAD